VHRALANTASRRRWCRPDLLARCLLAAAQRCHARAQASQQAKILQEEALRVAEVRRRIRATMVPTADADVRRLLRQVEQPVTLFGEREVRSPAAPAARQGRL